LVGIAAFVFGVHVATYWRLALHREFGYLQGHIIGVDLDGVLGRHREQFCKVLMEERDKDVAPESIVKIPVHECAGLRLCEEDEWAVFNQPRYWTEMAAYEDASYVLKRLRDVLHYEVLIFSWRPWPNWAKIPPEQLERYRRLWRRTSLPRITRQWLRDRDIPCDSLMIEEGNVDSPDRWRGGRNRFIVSRNRMIRLFVEDDLDKARRLADICEVVFLIKHPYNQNRLEGMRLPNNIIEVGGWKDIYECVRRHL
jgi:uncharacterized HAD superfamily protein